MTIFEARTLLTSAPGWIGLTIKLMLRYALALTPSSVISKERP